MFPLGCALRSEAVPYGGCRQIRRWSREHPCGVISGTAGSAEGAGGQHIQPSRPFFLAGGLRCGHLQRSSGFLLTHRPSATGGFGAGSASFQQDHSVLTDNSAFPPPPSKTSCFTPTPVLLRIFLVRHLRSLPIRCPMYNQTFSVGFFFLYIYIYINGGDISHRRRTRPCDGSCLYIARRLWHATFSQSFVARWTGVMWPDCFCSLWLCPLSLSPQFYLVIGRCCPFTLYVGAARSTKYTERKLFSTKLPAVWKTKEASLLLQISLAIVDANS